MPRIPEDRVARWAGRLTLVRAVGWIVTVAVVLVLLAGALEKLIEPKVFTSIGLAYWWAVVTVSTVGYGDVVPESTGGRFVAGVLMLSGLALIPTLTSVVVSVLLSKQSRADRAELEQGLNEQAAALGRIEQRLAELDPSGK